MAFGLAFVDGIGEVYTSVTDAFGRTVSNGWGNADTGQAWTTSGGSASDYSVGSGVGTHSLGSVNVSRRTILDGSVGDSDTVVTMVVGVLATGASIQAGVLARHADSNNYYQGEILLNTDQTVQVRLRKNVAGTFTTLVTSANVSGLTHTTGQGFRLRFQVVGPVLRARVWDSAGLEPSTWHAEATDTAFTSGQVGTRSVLGSGNTNTLPVAITFDNLAVTSPSQVRLNLNNDTPWRTLADGTDFGPPALRRAVASTLLADGEHIGESSYGNREITLVLDCRDTNLDNAATAVQNLSRELDRPTNFLRYKPDTTQAVFFRTFRSDYQSLQWDPVLRQATVTLLAGPFGHGGKESLPQVIVYNDPTEGTTLNPNPFFETDAVGWAGQGGTFVRSTAQFHEGVASGLLTPDGVTATVEARADLVPATAGLSYRVSAWVRCAATRNVNIAINFNTAAGGFISQAFATFAVTANVWAFVDLIATAPATTGQVRLIPASLTGTPPAGHTTHVDEARIRQSGGSGGMCFDTTGVKGDVEAPLLLYVTNGVAINPGSGPAVSCLATRRTGTPGNAPGVLQCESMTLGTDTTLPGNDAAMSGTGSNYARCSFATVTSMTTRVSINPWPASPSVDLRGRYRVFLRWRKSVAGDSINVRLKWGLLSEIVNDTVTLPTATAGPVLADLGTVTFPAGADPQYDGLSGTLLPVRGQGVAVDVQRASGSGNLDMDYLLFVPADEAMLFPDWSNDSGADYQVIDGLTENFVTIDAGALMSPVNAHMDGGGFPALQPGATNRVYFVLNARNYDSSGIATDSITSTATINPYYWPAYLYVRGPTT